MLGMGTHGVFVDANVLYSRTLRDWLGLLYTVPETPPFQVYWTEDVLAEVIVHLRRGHPAWSGGRLTAIRDRIASTFEVGRVADFVIDGRWVGRDAGDGHVHSAAVACGADILLTANVRDFRDDSAPYSVYAPDEFLVLVNNSVPQLVRRVIVSEVNYWLAKGKEPHLPQNLRSAGCPDFAEQVRTHLQQLSASGALTRTDR